MSSKLRGLVRGIGVAVAAALIGGVLASPGVAISTPIHAYGLNGNLLDALGGPPLISEGGTLGATAYEFGPNRGLTLENPALTNPGHYSIEVRLTLKATSSKSSWVKIIDFGDLQYDQGLYSFDHDSEPKDSILQYWPEADGHSNVVVAGRPIRIVFTRDGDAGTVTAYARGVSQFAFDDSYESAVFSEPNNVMRFLQDDQVTGFHEATFGSIDFIRIYDTVLTSAEVAALRD